MSENKFSLLTKKARIKKQLSLQKAADLLGTTKPHLWDMEKGYSSNPCAKLLNAMRRGYKIEAKTLLDSLAL